MAKERARPSRRNRTQPFVSNLAGASWRDRLRGWGGETRTRKCRFTKRWAELLGFPEHFRTRDFFARTAKGLIGGAEPLLAQLRPAADCSGLSAQGERVSGIFGQKPCLRSCFLLSRSPRCCACQETWAGCANAGAAYRPDRSTRYRDVRPIAPRVGESRLLRARN